MRVNYDLKYQQIIKTITNKKTLLLHSCCAPCSSAVLDFLKEYFDITVVYYNPNIFPVQEYEKRKQEQIRLLKILNIKFLDCDYDHALFLQSVKGLEEQKEGGSRCNVCFNLRLEYTAQKAKSQNFDFFGTTLTISPHKNEQIINLLGEKLQNKYNIQYLFADFKKHNGFFNSIKYSKQYDLYRQNYCGCEFSWRQNEQN